MCPTVPLLMLHVRGKPCFLQELHILIFYTFYNVFAEILWHLSLECKDVEFLVRLLATPKYFRIMLLKFFTGKFFMASFTIFLTN